MTKKAFSLITFSGTHGSGKSTASKCFASYLESNNINCYLINKRPIGTEYMYKTFKKLQNEPKFNNINVRYISFAYALDYYGDFKLNIEPLLEKGHVIMDRFVFDIYANVRTRFCKEYEDYNDSWELLSSLIINNSLHFYLDVSTNQAFERVDKRGDRQFFESLENIDSELSYYKEFLACPEFHFYTVNAEEDQHKVLGQIIDVFKSVIQ